MSRGKNRLKRERARLKVLEAVDVPVRTAARSSVKDVKPLPIESAVSFKPKEGSVPVKGEILRRSSVTDWCLAAFTLALVAVAIYQFIVTKGQLAITQDQLNVMQKDQRAWIFVTLKPEPFQEEPIPQLALQMKNYGKTPASNMVQRFHIALVPNGIRPSLVDSSYFDYGAELKLMIPNEEQPFVVSRKVEVNYGGVSKQVAAPLTPEEKAAFENGDSYFIVYGIVYYDDVYHTRHFHKFCSWIPHNGGSFTSFDCVNYNEADEQ